MGPLTQHGEGFHQDTRHFLTTASCQATTQIMPTSLHSTLHTLLSMVTVTTGSARLRGGRGEGRKTKRITWIVWTTVLVSQWVLVGINQGQFQYFSEIIKSESVGLRAMVGAQSGLFSHGGAWGQPSWSPVSSGGGGEAWPGLNCSTHDCLI